MKWTLTVTYLVGTGDEATTALNHSNTIQRADEWLAGTVGRQADKTEHFEGHAQLRELNWFNIPEEDALTFSKHIQSSDIFALPCSIKLKCVGNDEDISEAESQLLAKAIHAMDLNIDIPESKVSAYVDASDWKPGEDEPMSDQFPVIPSD